jgi:hypothetical protein
MCSSPTLPDAAIAMKWWIPELGPLAVVVACLLGCRERPLEAKASGPQFRGFIRLGPEQVSFQPCGASRSHRWWFNSAAPDESPPETWSLASDILKAQPHCDVGTMPCRLQEVYVEMDGKPTEPGRLGHMGAYERSLDLVRVHHASRNARGECAQPAK